eukprot:TRINITY_DN6012_c0_g1_i2.p2 TRINITY_DN6012_c0_g1~~TRINITY_DN6012_c0_g1_i2.p2  ORF type:complete len:219 (+),score=4.81 TRINITY_DN6012_c0_g1_i2:574-1230(+)
MRHGWRGRPSTLDLCWSLDEVSVEICEALSGVSDHEAIELQPLAELPPCPPAPPAPPRPDEEGLAIRRPGSPAGRPRRDSRTGVGSSVAQGTAGPPWYTPTVSAAFRAVARAAERLRRVRKAGAAWWRSSPDASPGEINAAFRDKVASKRALPAPASWEPSAKKLPPFGFREASVPGSRAGRPRLWQDPVPLDVFTQLCGHHLRHQSRHRRQQRDRAV